MSLSKFRTDHGASCRHGDSRDSAASRASCQDRSQEPHVTELLDLLPKSGPAIEATVNLRFGVASIPAYMTIYKAHACLQGLQMANLADLYRSGTIVTSFRNSSRGLIHEGECVQTHCFQALQ